MENREFMMGDISLPQYQSRFFHEQKGWEKIAELGEHIFFPHNDTLISPGDEIRYCYLVISGNVVSLEYTEEGTKHIFNFFGPGSLFLESNLLSDFPSEVYFETLTAVELMRIDAETLKDAMTRDFSITQFIVDSLSAKFYSSQDQLRENYNHDAMWKVYNMLVLLAANVGKPFDSWTMIDMDLNQQMISDMLGLNRITTHKVLKKLKDKDLVVLINSKYCIRYNSGMDTKSKSE